MKNLQFSSLLLKIHPGNVYYIIHNHKYTNILEKSHTENVTQRWLNTCKNMLTIFLKSQYFKCCNALPYADTTKLLWYVGRSCLDWISTEQTNVTNILVEDNIDYSSGSILQKPTLFTVKEYDKLSCQTTYFRSTQCWGKTLFLA